MAPLFTTGRSPREIEFVASVLVFRSGRHFHRRGTNADALFVTRKMPSILTKRPGRSSCVNLLSPCASHGSPIFSIHSIPLPVLSRRSDSNIDVSEVWPPIRSGWPRNTFRLRIDGLLGGTLVPNDNSFSMGCGAFATYGRLRRISKDALYFQLQGGVVGGLVAAAAVLGGGEIPTSC